MGISGPENRAKPENLGVRFLYPLLNERYLMNKLSLKKFYKEIKDYVESSENNSWLLKNYPIKEIVGLREAHGEATCGNGTCANDYIEVVVYYLDDQDRENEITFDMNMAEFLRGLK